MRHAISLVGKYNVAIVSGDAAAGYPAIGKVADVSYEVDIPFTMFTDAKCTYPPLRSPQGDLRGGHVHFARR